MLNYIKDSNLSAILGPTNTGKTYLAFERMLAHKSGVFGFPLRLLARENYDKAVKKKGFAKVALITGEEKILPEKATYYFCTVESMPLNANVEFVAIDEVQLCSDYERGHIFTDRVLNYRGDFETIFLGSTTIKSILKKIFPKIKIETRDRFSNLKYHNNKNISKIKPRSAVIAFNINKVYEIAENLRHLKGGSAVVLGSLSPRTRNAQVDLYENKKVDYLVATDAIGMGLNLNIDHIIFSSNKKYDGKYFRNLYPSEIGQIAGRAGRFRNDGTFSFTKEVGNIDPLIIESIEKHNFNEINKIYWRNSKIDFSTIKSVINSLSIKSNLNYFIHKRNAEDENSFRSLCNEPEIQKHLDNSNNVKLLWDVCRIPDFQKLISENYINLQKNIFMTLINNDYFIPENWLEKNILRLENISGDIEELSKRIANIRTWTYISNQANWIKNKSFWQEKTRNLEDALSDQLHIKLTNRFVDVTASHFVNNKDNEKKATIDINEDSSIIINGKKYGYIIGFNLKLLKDVSRISKFTYNNLKRDVRKMIPNKIENLVKAPSEAFNFGKIENIKISDDIKIYWGEEEIGYLKKGINIFSPKVVAYNSELIEQDQKKIITNKLQSWIDKKIETDLKPIKIEIDKEINSSSLRSIVLNLFDNLGSMQIEKYKDVIFKLETGDKTALSKLGIRTGKSFFYIPHFLKKNTIELKALLWTIFNESKLNSLLPLPKDGRVSFTSDIDMPDSYWFAIGYKSFSNFLVRLDAFEKAFFLARQKFRNGPFIESSDLMNPIGCNSDQLSKILDYVGYKSVFLGNEKRIFFFKKNEFKKKISNKRKKKIKINNKIKVNKPDLNSPFAVLKNYFD